MEGRETGTAKLYEPPTAKGRATRQAILDAAEEVFGEQSYDGASISEITRRAGVAQGTFYVYFPDKKAAFTELVRQLNHNLRRTLSEAIEGLDDRMEMERVGLGTFFEYVSRHRGLYRVVRESEFVDNETYRWHYLTLSAGYRAGLERAQRRNQITSKISADTIAWILMGIAEFLGGRWILWEDRPPPEDVFDEILTFIEHGIGTRGPEDAP